MSLSISLRESNFPELPQCLPTEACSPGEQTPQESKQPHRGDGCPWVGATGQSPGQYLMKSSGLTLLFGQVAFHSPLTQRREETTLSSPSEQAKPRKAKELRQNTKLSHRTGPLDCLALQSTCPSILPLPKSGRFGSFLTYILQPPFSQYNHNFLKCVS